jgi:hypothetical protein
MGPLGRTNRSVFHSTLNTKNPLFDEAIRTIFHRLATKRSGRGTVLRLD